MIHDVLTALAGPLVTAVITWQLTIRSLPRVLRKIHLEEVRDD